VILISIYSNLELVNLVHVQRNAYRNMVHPPNNKTYYFVEMDVRFKRGKTSVFRASHFVQPTENNEFCFIRDFTIRPKAEINLLTPIKNQKKWLLYMIQMLQDIIVKTNEQNVSFLFMYFLNTYLRLITGS